MGEHYKNDLQSFKKFLDHFCSNVITDQSDEDDVLPIKVFNKHFRPDELQGECIEWTLRYLGVHNCPPTLASLIAKEVYHETKKIDLLEFEFGRDRDAEEIQSSEEKERICSPDQLPSDLDGSLVCDHVIDVIHDVCKKWAESFPFATPPAMVNSAYYHEIRNTRRKMEDRHVIMPDFNSLFDIKDMPFQSYYAVFDGHAGIEAAVYASTHLHLLLQESDKFREDIPAALKHAYTATDDRFIKKAERENLKSGCTGLSVFIRGDKLHVAWLGDSQAVLVRDGEVVELVNPHKPEREDEKLRIEELGGSVHMLRGVWRVNLTLSVSRAIGDVGQKKYICSDADTKTETLDGTEDYIVLACDGLWDSVNKQDLPKRVQDSLVESGGDKSAVPKDLVTWAKDCGSSDNITVVVVFLRDVIAPPKVQTVFNFGATPSSQEGKGEEGGKDCKSGGSNSGKEAGKGDNKHTSHHKSRHLPKDDDDIMPSDEKYVDSEVLSQESSENGELENGVNLAVDSSHGRDSFDTSQIESVSDNIPQESSKSESVTSERLPSRHKLTKNEPVFIFENHSNQNSPRVASNVEETRTKGRDSQKSDRAASLPNHVHYNGVVDTISEFHNKLRLEGFQETGKKKLPALLEAPVLSDYAFDSDNEREMKKEVTKKKSKRLRKLHREYEVKDSIESYPTRTRKRIEHSGPIVWAFTGKNVAPVQNYKLKQAAKTSHSLISPRMALASLANNGNYENNIPAHADINYIDKLTRAKPFFNADTRNIENAPMHHTIFDYPLSTFTSSYSSPSTKSTVNSYTSASDISSNYSGKSKDRNSKHGFQPWRPRRTSKFGVGGAFSEVPPTPLSNSKIQPPANESVDR